LLINSIINMKVTLSLLFITLIFYACNQTQQAAEEPVMPHFDTSLSMEARIQSLLDSMTLDEKVGQMRYDAPAIERLNIPAYNWWNECLHGVGRAGEATVFPQAIGMGSMWDTTLMHQIAVAISDEARAKHNHFAELGYRGIYQGLTFWTPNINIFRDPRWGRGQETYGEDPFLTGRMAVNFIKGLQGDDPKYLKLVATSKHFAVHSGPEKTRHSDNYQTSDRDLWETYLPAFEATVKDAKVHSIMCAYNRFRDEACCGSNLLLDSILRDTWGFDGYIVSDCWAINDFYMEGRHGVAENEQQAAALAVERGTDLNCGNTFYPHLVASVQAGMLPESELDKALARLLRAKMLLGMFDPKEDVPYNAISHDVVRSQKHLDLALEASRKSMVLLKNEGDLLPLSKEVKSVAVIGPNADDEQVLLGNYHGTALKYTTPLAAIKQKLPNAQVTYAEGSMIAPNFPLLHPIPAAYLSSDGQEGLKAEYFDNMNWEGAAVKTEQVATVNHKWTTETPISGIVADTFSIRYSGKITANEAGTYRIGVKACNIAKLTLNDSTYVDFDNIHHPTTRYTDLELAAGESVAVTFEYANYHTDPQAHLLWARLEDDRLSPALAAAKEAEVVVLCLGLSPEIEGEEMPIVLDGFDKGDRTKLGLPAPQLELMKQIKALGKPTVLVTMNGSAMALNWADQHIPAILEAWYPGEFGGQAIADVLFGDYNPGGKLPVTFYRSASDLPEFTNYDMANRTYKYFDGKPLYPFGHGLSYTSFAYEQLQVPERVGEGESITVSAQVTNTGDMAGEEVVQLYVAYPDSGPLAPKRSLIGFARVDLQPGASQTVSFTLSFEQYAIVSETGEKVMPAGRMRFSMGGKQPGYSGNADAATTGVVSADVASTASGI